MKKMKRIIALIVFSCLTACVSKAEIARDFNSKLNLKLNVVYLEDTRFPSLGVDVMEKSLSIAKSAIANAFGAQNVSFSKIDTMNINSFFNKVLNGKKNAMNVLDPFSPDIKPLTKRQRTFFETWELNKLKNFLPESDRAGIKSYDDYYKYIFSVWVKKAEKFKSLMIYEKPAFTKDTLYFQTYSGWMLMFEMQSEYDVFFTNTLIFFDDLDQPYPHSIFKHAKVGGMGETSPNAPNGSKNALMISTIPFSDLPYFSEGNIAKNDIPKAMGIYYIAHEFGHMFFNLEDVYDHPLFCIMNTPPENIPVAKAVSNFESHKGICPLCEKAIIKGMQYKLKELGKSDKK